MEGKQNPTAHNWQLFDNWKHPAAAQYIWLKTIFRPKNFFMMMISAATEQILKRQMITTATHRDYDHCNADDDDDESRDDSISKDDVDDILTRSEYISCNAATLSALKFSSTFSLGKWFGIIMYKEGLFFLLWLSNIAEDIFTVNNIFCNTRSLWSTSP